MKGNAYRYEVLPPWIVYPLLGPASPDWRQAAEAYVEIYICYAESLPEDQYTTYLNKYPTPEYMKENCFGLNLLNHYIRKNL